MGTLTTKAIRDVTRRRLRTALTVAGIAIGVMGLTAVSVASAQMTAGLDYLNSSTQPDARFFTAPAKPEEAARLASQPNVKSVQAETFVNARWAVPSGHGQLGIVGLADFNDKPFNPFKITAGTLPGPGGILMEESDSSVKPFHVGDSVQLQIGIYTTDLRIAGITSTPGAPSPAFSGRGTAYMREADLQRLYGLGGSNLFLVRLDDYGKQAQTARQLGDALRQDGVTVLGSQVGRDITGGSGQIVTGIFTVMGVLSGIAILLTVFLLLSTITTLMAEQVPVIGTMKAIGAGGGQVLRNYLTGIAIYGVTGTAIGFGLGVGLGDLLYRFFALNLGMDPNAFTFSPGLVVTAVAVGVGVPLVAALLPVHLGTRVTVKQALSGYGLSSGRNRFWGPLASRLLGFLPASSQLGLRGLFRRPVRAWLTIAALAIAGAAFLAVQTTSNSWNYVISDVFSTDHTDLFVTFDNPQPYSEVEPNVEAVPGIARVEPLTESPVKTGPGQANLFGLHADTQLYRKHLLKGRWISDSDVDSVVISKDFAQRSGLQVGDYVHFSNDLASADWQVVGIVRDNSNPTGAGVLIAPLAETDSFLGLPAESATGLFVLSSSRSQRDIDRLAKRLDAALGGTKAQASVYTAQYVIQANDGIFLVLYALFYAVVVIIALVGGIGLFNALAMGVLERRREIGILRSMGATGRKVALVFWTEGVSLGLVSWLIAVAIGIPGAYYFVQLLGAVLLKADFVFDPFSVVAMLAFVVVVASLATVGPVWSASRIKIAETLRYE